MTRYHSTGLVLGIDPGAWATGFGVVEACGSLLRPRAFGVIRVGKGDGDLASRLLKIFHGIVDVIEEVGPTECAVEAVFTAKNPRSSLVLGHARGVSILAAKRAGLSVHEYTPMEVKKAVVGYGRAQKNQIQTMVKRLLNLKGGVPQDAADALAIAICHLNTVAFFGGLDGQRDLKKEVPR